MEAQASYVSGSPIGYELRLDFLQDPTDLDSKLRQMLMRLHFPQTIATCRRSKAGGLFRGSVKEQAAILAGAVHAGCQWVDIEMESVVAAGPSLLQQFRPAKVIVSYHNYTQMPDLRAIYRRLARLPARVVKIASQARLLTDNLRIHRLLRSFRSRSPKLVALALASCGRVPGVRGSLRACWRFNGVVRLLTHRSETTWAWRRASSPRISCGRSITSITLTTGLNITGS